MPDADKQAGWLKDIDIGRTVENSLVGTILFIGRYFKTFVLVLFRPHDLLERVILRSDYKDYSQLEFVRPLTFLVVSGFIYLVFFLQTSGVIIAIEPVIERFDWLIEKMPTELGSLSLAKVATFMVPFVLFVALYSLVSSVVFSRFSSRNSFKVQLNINSYMAGTFAIMLGIFSLFEGSLWDAALGDGYAGQALLLTGATLYWLLILFWAYRYVFFVKKSLGVGWLKSALLVPASFVLFWAITLPLLSLLRPFLVKLK